MQYSTAQYFNYKKEGSREYNQNEHAATHKEDTLKSFYFGNLQEHFILQDAKKIQQWGLWNSLKYENYRFIYEQNLFILKAQQNRCRNLLYPQIQNISYVMCFLKIASRSLKTHLMCNTKQDNFETKKITQEIFWKDTCPLIRLTWLKLWKTNMSL